MEKQDFNVIFDEFKQWIDTNEEKIDSVVDQIYKKYLKDINEFVETLNNETYKLVDDQIVVPSEGITSNNLDALNSFFNRFVKELVVFNISLNELKEERTKEWENKNWEQFFVISLKIFLMNFVSNKPFNFLTVTFDLLPTLVENEYKKYSKKEMGIISLPNFSWQQPDKIAFEGNAAFFNENTKTDSDDFDTKYVPTINDFFISLLSQK
jgi:hypothetical protein